MPTNPAMPSIRAVEKHRWRIFGKVVDFKGEPVRQANVHIDLGYGAKLIRDVQTDLQGRFSTEYELEFTTFKTVVAKLSVDREGYHAAREIVDFGNGDKTWEITITMREDTGDPEELAEESLVNELGQKLKSDLETETSVGSGRKDLARGMQELFDRREPLKAVDSLNEVSQKSPDCVDCRMLLGLARLEAGGLNGAAREFIGRHEGCGREEQQSSASPIEPDLRRAGRLERRLREGRRVPDAGQSASS